MNNIQARYASRFPFSVQERDIDLLLLEQLHVADEFVNWLSNKLDLPGATLIGAHHSVQTVHGETDVLVYLQHEAQAIAVMIEDKIGAPMQPNQYERYHVRGKELCDNGQAERYLTVLCAPLTYLSGVPAEQAWEHRLALEDLAQVMESLPLPGWQWRQAILLTDCSRTARAREADSKANVAYDDALLNLKRDYREFVNAHYPRLKASRQEGRDREYDLNGKGFPTGIRFKHAFFRGEVSVVFENKWVESVQEWFSKHTPEEVWICMHGRELHVRSSVEVLDPQLPLNQQLDVVKMALDRICLMIPWAEEIAGAGNTQNN